MKRSLLILLLIASVLTFLGGLDVTHAVSLFPPQVGKWILLIPSAALVIAKLVLLAGDILDDGSQNGSFKLKALVGALLIPASLLLASCSTNGVGSFGTGSVSYTTARYEVTYSSTGDGGRTIHYLDLATKREYRATRGTAGAWTLEAKDPASGLWLTWQTDGTGPKLNLPGLPADAQAQLPAVATTP